MPNIYDQYGNLLIKVNSIVEVTGPLTDAQLRASPVPVSASIDTTGLATATRQDTGNTSLSSIDSKFTTLNAKDFATQTTLALIKTKTDNIDVAISTLLKAADTLTRVATVDTITNPVATTTQKASTSSVTSVSVLITDTIILAASATRLGATIYNESGAICYVKLGLTASLTIYTVQIAIGGYYEIPYGYTGAINGITVAITAVIRVTSLSA